MFLQKALQPIVNYEAPTTTSFISCCIFGLRQKCSAKIGRARAGSFWGQIPKMLQALLPAKIQLTKIVVTKI